MVWRCRAALPVCVYLACIFSQHAMFVPVQCIKKWVAVEGEKDGAAYLCPVCRSPCIAYLYNCNESTCERVDLRHTLQTSENRPDGFLLSPEHRIRRSMYQHSPDNSTAIPDSSLPGLSPNQTSANLNGVSLSLYPSFLKSLVQLRTLADPAVTLWLRRELQALLLTNEPGFVQQV